MTTATCVVPRSMETTSLPVEDGFLAESDGYPDEDSPVEKCGSVDEEAGCDALSTSRS